MKTLTFSGYSDDNFGLLLGDTHDNCADGKPVEWLLESTETGERVLVVGQYAPGEAYGWLIGVAPAGPDDEEPIPGWNYRLRRPRPGEINYSPVLEIDVPDDTTLRCLQRSSDAD